MLADAGSVTLSASAALGISVIAKTYLVIGICFLHLALAALVTTGPLASHGPRFGSGTATT
ncbi:hypothetical protein GCM10011610_27670 [Nocardia rhizosphaerihabitans]|uniref:Uncharacterized protein n=1 Tax=Nocardia rhizosphaerihabitans TaxID=1691570 RepID=A0ABQ2KEF7_9NOCA|nr:hypothetical protein GCM10011610_27670 [Nocardia rhizosphaerihabitans]